MTAICCEFDPAQFSTATGAANWVRAAYPEVTVTLDRDMAQLVANSLGEVSLRLIWRTAFANELLFEHGKDQRAVVLKALVE